MPKGKHDIRLIRGDTWPQIKFIFQYAGGVARSLFGADIVLQVRQSWEGAVLRELTVGNGFNILGDGENELTIPQGVLGGLEAGTYVYDMQITWPDTSIETPFGGQVIVTQDITQ